MQALRPDRARASSSRGSLALHLRFRGSAHAAATRRHKVTPLLCSDHIRAPDSSGTGALILAMWIPKRSRRRDSLQLGEITMLINTGARPDRSIDAVLLITHTSPDCRPTAPRGHSTSAITRAGLASPPLILNGKATSTNLFLPICDRLVTN